MIQPVARQRYGRARHLLVGALLCLLASCVTPDGGRHLDPGPPSGFVRVQILTAEGPIEVDVQTQQSPKVAAWFLALVAEGAFDGTKFFRAGHQAGQPARPRFIEGGMISRFILGEAGTQPRSAAEAGLPMLRDWETTAVSGLRHARGSFGFARDIAGDGSVIPDIVITLEDVPELDHGSAISPGGLGFPVVGYVVRGMEIVDRIAARPRGRKTYLPVFDGQILDEPVRMERVRVVRRSN